MIDFSDTDNVGEYLKDSKIIRMYTPRGRFEGGLTFIFDKDGEVGIYIIGYSELGDSVEYFSHKDISYPDFDDIFCLTDKKEVNITRIENGFEEV